jgi:hypothetical protein
MPTMAISNCLFSPTSENPRGFKVWCVLAKLDTIRKHVILDYFFLLNLTDKQFNDKLPNK